MYNLSDMQTRPAIEADLADVVQLMRLAGDNDITADMLSARWRQMKLETQTCVVVSREQQIIAYAEAFRHSADLFSVSLSVHPDYRGRCIGTVLLQHIETNVRKICMHRSVKLLAQVTGNNYPAWQLLQKSGYLLSSTFQTMEISLTNFVAEQVEVPAIVVRPFTIEQNEQTLYEADEEAFLDERGKEPRTLEQWRDRFGMNMPRFDLMLVYCRGWG